MRNKLLNCSKCSRVSALDELEPCWRQQTRHDWLVASLPLIISVDTTERHYAMRCLGFINEHLKCSNAVLNTTGDVKEFGQLSPFVHPVSLTRKFMYYNVTSC